MRRLKQIKSENVKANIGSRQTPSKYSKSPDKSKISDDATLKEHTDSEKQRFLGDSTIQTTSDDENHGDTSHRSGKSKKSKSRSKSRQPLSEIAEDNDLTTIGDSSSRKSY